MDWKEALLMQHHTLSSKQGTIHYWTAGSGEETILFTHGATMDHGLFQHQVAHFAQGYRVIVWDVAAHGRSRPYAPFSFQDAANQLIAILGREQIAKAHLVGQSMGGYISQFVARDHPERVASFTAVGSSPMQPLYYSKLDMWLLGLTPKLLSIYPYRSLISTIGNQIAVEGSSRAYALDTLKSYTKAEIATIMEAVAQGVADYGREEPLAVPILIVVGEHDRSGKVQAYCAEWAARENRPLHQIEDAAHNANMDNPTTFNQVLERFLTELGSISAEASL